jgi:hypothetical protein
MLNDPVLMNRGRQLPYDWPVVNTLWQRKPEINNEVQHALAETARLYQRALRPDVDIYAEICCKKHALAGVVVPVTERYDVPLIGARGYASLSFLHSAAEAISELEVPAFDYHCGDFDPSGVNAAEKIEETLRDLAPDAEIIFERLAVTPEQIAAWELPTRPTKQSDPRAKGFCDICVELDAIDPRDLRDLVEEAINRHVPQDQLKILKVAEESAREQFRDLAGGLM